MSDRLELYNVTVEFKMLVAAKTPLDAERIARRDWREVDDPDWVLAMLDLGRVEDPDVLVWHGGEGDLRARDVLGGGDEG